MPFTKEELEAIRLADEELEKTIAEEQRKKKAAYQRGYRERNKEKIVAYKRGYYERNKEKIAAHQREYRERKKLAGIVTPQTSNKQKTTTVLYSKKEEVSS